MRKLIYLSLFLVFMSNQKIHADSTREFLLSCAYGTVAGTIIGAASLAFTKQPGENLQLIARGASLGLYGGIILGWYVTRTPDENIDPALVYYKAPKTPYLQALVDDKGTVNGALMHVPILNF